MSWAANNDIASAPTFVNQMCGYANVATAYANTSTAQQLWAPDAAKAAGTDYHQGWVVVNKGVGAAISVAITTPGTGYANTDKWSLTSGTKQANGSITTNASGVITAVTLDNAGAGFRVKTATATITTSAGTSGVITVTVGGKVGRITHETLVATAAMTTANSAQDYTSMM